MPRVAIENLKLIEIDDLINLIGKDLEAIRCALADSPYSKQISAVSLDTLNYSFLEAALLQNFAETIQKLVKSSSGNIKKLLIALSKKLEVSNTKTILRAIKAQIDVSEALKNIIPIGVLDKDKYRAILEASGSVENAIAALSASKYGKVLKQVVEECGNITDLALLEVSLDKAVYREILENVEKLTGVDKKIVKAILEIEIDAINIKVILKSKELSISPEIAKNYLVPPALFTEELLEKSMESVDLKSMIEYLLRVVESSHPVYRKMFTQLLKESSSPLPRFEPILDKVPIEMSLYQLREHGRYYNTSFLLAFLNLKWAEVKNLRCIVKGSERKVPPSQVQKLLMIPDVWKKSQMICRSS